LRSEVDFTLDARALEEESTDFDPVDVLVMDSADQNVKLRRTSSDPSGFSTPTSERGIDVEPGQVVTLIIDLGAVNLRIGVAGRRLWMSIV
jgi:hypothetical protein